MTVPENDLRRDERGVTLVELIVTSALLAIMLAIIATFFTTFSRTLSEDRASTTSATTAAIGMNELTRVVRAGTEIPVAGQTLNKSVFITAGRETVTLHAYIDTPSTAPKPLMVQFSIDASRELVEKRWNSFVINGSYWGFPATSATPASERVIARKILTPGVGQPYLFTYYDEAGVALIPTVGGLIAPSDLSRIAAVRISMTVQADPTNRADPVQLQNTVGIPNLGISRIGPAS